MRSFCKVDERERQRFLIGEVENPRFSLCSVAASVLPQYRERVLELRSELEREEKDPNVRKLYLAKLDKRLDFIPMYTAAENRNDAEFHAHALNIYGKPKRQFFEYAAKRIKDLVAERRNTPFTESHRKLHRVFAKIDTSLATLSNEILPPPVADTTPVITAAEAAELMRESLMNYGIDDWQVVYEPTTTRTRFATNPTKQLLFVPSDQSLQRRKKPLTRLGATAIAAHEIGVHALRNHNGLRQPLQLLSFGLAGYLRGEEGLASYVQQQIEGATEFYGFDRYLAITLAIGMDGEQRDFRSVFECMRHYYLLSGEADEQSEHRASNAAWETCARIFRGTTGTSIGTPYMRDIVYFEGNVGIWNLLIERPEIFDSLFIGKFNPMNADQTKALHELGILSWS